MASLLAQIIGQAESGNNPNASLVDYDGNVSVNAQYQQGSGWINNYTWGGAGQSGAAGIDNEAAYALSVNPNMTLGEFYSAYNHGSPLPWSTYSSLYPTQANNFLNNAQAAGYNQNTPLSSIVGNAASSNGGSNDPLGYSLSIDPNGAAEFGNGATVGNDQGTPNLGGGITSPQLGTQGNNTAYIGSGQPVNITDLKGLGTDVGGAGKDVQTGAQNAATGITGTLASAINAVQTYTSNAFVVIALVVLGLILVAYGLGLFGKRTLAEAGI